MKKRLIAAAVLIPVALVIVLALPKLVGVIVISLMLAIASYEMLYRTGAVQHQRLVLYSAAMAFGVGIWSYYGANHAVGVLMCLAFFLVLFGEMMANHLKVRMEMVGLCVLGGLLMPYLLSALIRIFSDKVGRYLVIIPFVIACANDAGAFFVGMKFGAHKLAPVISPNKTIEGFLGGILSGTVGMLLYTLILSLPTASLNFRVNYGYALIYGLVGSVAAGIGDLAFSAVKRQTGIKDYGELIPGHGGVLDRFDSMVVVAPLIEALLTLLPVAEG